MRFSERLEFANYRVISKQNKQSFVKTDFCDEKKGNLRDFVRYFPNSFPRNFFFFPRNLFSFPRDFENVRQNQENIRQNPEKVGER